MLAAQQSTVILSILTGVYVSLKHLLQRELGGQRLGLEEDNNHHYLYSNWRAQTDIPIQPRLHNVCDADCNLDAVRMDYTI